MIQDLGVAEHYVVTDTFVSGLAGVEHIGGGCYRFVFYATEPHGDREERFVVAKLVAPAEAVPPALLLAAKSVGFCFISGAHCKTGHTH